MITVDKELAQKWVDALRSGEYDQTRVALHKKDSGFCCLGVLAEIIQPNTWYDKPADPDEMTRLGELLHPLQQGSDEYLSSKKVSFGPDEDLQTDGTSVRQAYYASLNDNGRTFNEIADVIAEDFDLV